MAPCSGDRVRVWAICGCQAEEAGRTMFRALVGGLGELGTRRKDICNQVPEVHTDGSFVAHRVGRKQ